MNIDFRKQIREGYDYFVCYSCGFPAFILTINSDSIFPDTVCAKCGSIRLRVKENPLRREGEDDEQ